LVLVDRIVGSGSREFQYITRFCIDQDQEEGLSETYDIYKFGDYTVIGK
jgi:hypothetical protein